MKIATKRLILMWMLILMISLLLPGCGGGGNTSDSWGGGSDTAITSVAIDPGTAAVPLGKSVQFTAMATISDGSTYNVSDSVTWASSNDNVASVSQAGLATARSAGQVTITATHGTFSAQASLSVTIAAMKIITITPAAPTIPVGRRLQLTATGTYDDGTTYDITNTVAWTSSNTAVVTIDSQGMMTVTGPGTATVMAAENAITGNTTVTASTVSLQSIQLTPLDPELHNGEKLQFTATGTFSDGTTHDLTTTVKWTTSSTQVATISDDGLSMGMAPGTTTITAIDLDSPAIKASTTLTVTAGTLKSIIVTPPAFSLPVGRRLQYTAIGTYDDGTTTDLTNTATWTSSSAGVAGISSAGLATAQGAGQAVIKAVQGTLSGQASLTVTSATLKSIAVTPQSPSVPVDRHLQLTAMGTFDDGTTHDLSDTATWKSSDTSIVTVDNLGQINVVKSGKATVTATENGVSGSTEVTATTATLVSIDVAPDNPTLRIGDRLQFKAIGTFSDGTTHELSSTVTWTSSNTQAASISDDGLCTAIAQGSTTITAIDLDNPRISGTSTLKVSNAAVKSITVTPPTCTLPAGRNVQLKATATYENGVTSDVTATAAWKSSKTDVVTVDSNGLATAAAQGSGTSTVTATKDGKIGDSTITVNSVTLVSLLVSPTNPTIQVGKTQQFTATGKFSDGSTHDVTGESTWTSSDPKVAPVTAAGLATGAAKGSTSITATVTGIKDESTLNVTDSSKLVSLAVTPDPASLVFGQTASFTATGTFQDGTTRDLTETVNWASSDHAIATISDSTGSKGKATAGNQAGTTNITATSSDLTITSKPARLTVGQKGTLVSIAIYSTDNCMKTGGTLQYKASGYYDDNTVSDISGSVTWASSDKTVATIDQKGLATGVATGSTATTAISATPKDSSSVVGVLTLTVNPVASSGSQTITIVNKSGIPDEAVFLLHWGQNQDTSVFYYNPFCKTATTVPFTTTPAQTVGNQYSYPLVSLTKTGANTYTFPCPADNMFMGRVNVSLTVPIQAGPAGSSTSMTQPATATPVPWDFFEPNIQVVGGTKIINFDTSNVDFFSIGLQESWTLTDGSTKTMGFVEDGRDKVIDAFGKDQVFNQCMVKKGSTTVKVLAPYNVSTPTQTLSTWLDTAIANAWTRYQGPNNPNIPASGWTYGSFTYQPDTGPANTINVKAGSTSIQFQKPTSTMQAFQQQVTGDVATQNLQAIIYAALMRGVCEDYSSWGAPAPTNYGYPDKYYKSTTVHYSNYAEILHLYSLPVIHADKGPNPIPACYAFSADDHYKQDPDSGNIPLTQVQKIELTIPHFDRSK